MAIGFWAVSKEPGLMAGLAERETSMLFCSIIRFADGHSNGHTDESYSDGKPWNFFFPKGERKTINPQNYSGPNNNNFGNLKHNNFLRAYEVGFLSAPKPLSGKGLVRNDF